MRLASHLARSRHGVFQFRVVLPAPIAEAIGRREIRRSLGTREPARARLAAYELSAKIVPIVHSLARKMASKSDKPNPEDVAALVASLGDKIATYELDLSRGVMRADGPEDHALMMEALDRFTVARERTLPRVSEGMPTQPPSEAALERARQEQALLAECAKPAPRVARPVSVAQAVAGFLRFKKDTAPGTCSTYSRRLEVFEALAGGGRRMFHTIDEAEAADIAEAFSALPASAHGRDIKPAAQMLADKPKGKTIGSGTIGDHLTLIAAFFNWAIRSRHHPGPNFFKDVPKPKGGKVVGGAEPFSRSELEKIFAPDVLAAMSRPHRFWGPLLGLFTGARSNEIAQLRLCDFVEEGGLRCIRITHDEAAGTRTKNEDSIRLLPLHATLFEMGLEDYLDDVRAVGGERLFPTLPLDVHGKREKYLSRDFNELHLKDLGLWVSRRKVFHSFRDTATQALTDADVADYLIESWLGHSTKGITGSHYRKKPLPARLAEKCLPALGFDFLNLGAVKYEKGRWNDWMARHLCP